MAIGNKVLLGSESSDSEQEQPVKNEIRGVKKITPKFAPGMRFPCQE